MTRNSKEIYKTCDKEVVYTLSITIKRSETKQKNK